MPDEPRFDYAALDADTREFLQNRAAKIHGLAPLMAAANGCPKFPFAWPRHPTFQEIAMMGGFLCGIKADLGHGRFIDWVRTECPFSYRTAHRYMSVYRAFFKTDTLADMEQESTDEQR